MNNNSISNVVFSNVKVTVSGRAYPEIRRVNNQITTYTVKEFLHTAGLLTEEQLHDNTLGYEIIAPAILAAFARGLLSLNATKQTGILNNTPVRMSTGLGGKMKGVWAFSTLSLCNAFCLKRMQMPDLVCYHCYVKKSLHIAAVMNYVQNFFVLTAGPLPVDWIPVINPKNAGRHPIIRLESFGDLFNTQQADNYLTIARNNDAFSFALWTKNPNVLSQAIEKTDKPANLSTVLSMSVVDKMAPAGRFDHHFDHKFIVVTNQAIKDNYLQDPARFYPCKCGPKSCINCRACYTKSAPGMITTAVELLRK